MQENAHLSFSAPLPFPYIPPHISSGVLPSNSTPAKKIHIHTEPPPTQTEGQRDPDAKKRRRAKRGGKGEKKSGLFKLPPRATPVGSPLPSPLLTIPLGTLLAVKHKQSPFLFFSPSCLWAWAVGRTIPRGEEEGGRRGGMVDFIQRDP